MGGIWSAVFCFGGKTGIRTLGRGKPSPVFKTGALNQLDHLSSEQLLLYQHVIYYVNTFSKKFFN